MFNKSPPAYSKYTSLLVESHLQNSQNLFIIAFTKKKSQKKNFDFLIFFTVSNFLNPLTETWFRKLIQIETNHGNDSFNFF